MKKYNKKDITKTIPFNEITEDYFLRYIKWFIDSLGKESKKLPITGNNYR